jgi:lipid-A-disaccharide synthase
MAPSIKSDASVLIIAGEASGDMHGASLVQEVRNRRSGISFFGIGGDEMQKAGVETVFHARQMAFLGFFEVLKHYPFIRRVFGTLCNLVDSRKPDCVVLIDYPGFNLRFADRMHKRGVPVFYYISPQVWAWGKGRVKKMARIVDRMAVIFPFEEGIYSHAGIPVKYVGHPLKDRVKSIRSKSDFFKELGLNPDYPTVGLLPGSRSQEVQKLLPEMMGAYQRLAEDIPRLQALVGLAPTLSRSELVRHMTGQPSSVRIVEGRTHETMAHSDAVMVASGTATLETALLGTPMVILYKMAPLSYTIVKRLVKIESIGLANIVAGKRVAQELIQKEANAERIYKVIRPLLLDPNENARSRNDLKIVSEKLGEGGASARAAEWLIEMIDLRRQQRQVR